MSTESLFPLIALATAVAVPAYAWHVRGRTYAIFSAVILAIALPGALLMHPRLLALLPEQLGPWLDFAFAASMAAAAFHLAHLVRARLRSRLFRFFVSVPGQAFIAAGALSGLWLLFWWPIRALLSALGADGALGVLAWLDWLPFLVAGVSVLTSTRPVVELVRIHPGHAGPEEVTRVPVQRYRQPDSVPPLATRPLRIVQITDPHLGPWQSIASLRRTIARLLEHDPDLVLLTGDFLTMEGMGSEGALREALEPLKNAAGRCFAIFGNHDHEAPDEVRHALEANGVTLLVDQEAVVDTPVGPVQIIGADWSGRKARERLPELLDRHPPREEHTRILLLHDPQAFQYVPPGDVHLTLSGHTHGGQLGLVSLGFDWTVLSRSDWPDHGLFARGASRLYVHRGTGFYGFPLRIGVPGEASLLEYVIG